MRRCRAIILGLLLVSGVALAQQYEYGENPYLSSDYKNDVNAFLSDQRIAKRMDLSDNIFIQNMVKNGIYSGPEYLPPVERRLTCSGSQVCALRDFCYNGYFSQGPGSSRKNCDSESEVCCQYRPPPTTTTTQRPTTPRPTPVPSTPCNGNDFSCVSPALCINGVIQSNGFLKSVSQPKSFATCYAPEVCCRIPEPESTVLTNDGYVVRVPETPFTQRPYTPDVTQRENVQPTTQRPFVQQTTQRQYVQPTTQRPYVQPTTQRPYVTSQTQRPYVPPQTQRPYIPPQTQRPYVPPQTQSPYVPPQTQRPYVPPQTQRPYAPPQTPRPYVAPTTVNREYLPPTQTTRRPPYVPDRIPQPSIEKPNRVPLRGEDQLGPQIYPPVNGGNQLGGFQPSEKCAAALNCTEVTYCDATGVISKTPVILTPNEELYRVPLTDCYNPEGRFNGKCCRNPDYKDPWPLNQLGQYKGIDFGFDTGAYNPGSNGNGRRSQTQSQQRPQPQPQQTKINEAVLSLPIQPNRSKNNYRPSGQCISRNVNGSPQGPGPYDAAFSEYPWQVMILLESSKSLLCGGAIIGSDLIATAAHCVDGRKPFDVLVKAGEWKLGSDEEPLDFQIVRVKKIEVNSAYDANSLKNDIALLHLDSKLNFNEHIGPICVDDNGPQPNDQCVTTGWGKPALRVHAKDAVMHHSPVSILPSSQCSKQLDGYHYGNAICGQPEVDACELDYGSALACVNGRGQYVLKGIYSTEDQCGGVINFEKPDLKWIQAAKTNQPYTPEAAASNQYSTQAPIYLPPSY